MVMRDDNSGNLHFFKALMPGFSKKLAIPTGFVEHIMKETSSTKAATLVSPNGQQWHVDIRKDKSIKHDVYFCGHGWLKFVHAHNLGLGYFLVFGYRGNMLFDTRVYDLSTCEITSYASSDAHKEDFVEESSNAKLEKEKKKRIKIKIEDDESDELTSKKKRKISQGKIKNHENYDKSSNKRIKKESIKKKNQSTNKGEETHFEATIWPCNISSSYMNIPWDFADANGLTEHEGLTLKDPQDRSWPVCIKHRRTRFGNGRNSSYMSKGWQEFAIANELKLGDKCRFEFESEVNNGKVVMKVEIWKKVA